MREPPTPSSLAAQLLVAMNELKSKENDINKYTTNHFETNEQVTMSFDIGQNEIRDGGERRQ